MSHRSITFRPPLAEILHLVVDRSPFGDQLASIPLSLCGEHANFRRWWPSSAAVLLAIFVLSVLASVLPIFIPGHDSMLWFMAATAIAVAALGLLALVIQQAFRIRATKISSIAVTLVGVDQRFAEACKAIYQRDDAAIASNL